MSVRATRLGINDVTARFAGGAYDSVLQVSRSFFSRSDALRGLRSQLDSLSCWATSWERGQALQLRMSPSHSVNIPKHIREATGVHSAQPIHFAWVYPAELKVPDDSITIDLEDPDVSFLTVGGYLYFVQPVSNSSSPQRLQVLCALTVRYSMRGALQFSAPRRWESKWTARLVAQGRFHPIRARKWLALGAKHFCWVRPDEMLPDAQGKERPHAQNGGFAFLFHGLDVSDDQELDRYFEVVAAPFSASCFLEGTTDDPSIQSRPQLQRFQSLPYSLNSTPASYKRSLLEKIRALARHEKWPLVRHLLREYPHLAVTTYEAGATLLHICMESNVEADTLKILKKLGADCDAVDAKGRTPLELGTPPLRALIRNVWGISPDVNAEPEAWFRFNAGEDATRMEACQFSYALASAYLCNAIGSQWVKSYVHVNHPAGVTKAELLGEDGLLRRLQINEEFLKLRQQASPPPLFRGHVAELDDAKYAALLQVEQRLQKLRCAHGWYTGKPAPPSALPMQLPAPSALGTTDAGARLRSARMILDFSFEQTRHLDGPAWRRGFRVDFAGQQGLDDGGLSKAWVAEIAFALWADNTLFDVNEAGSFFKPDPVESLSVEGVEVQSMELYRWTGRFIAYTLYQRCIMDCRLCAWAFRALQRATEPRQLFDLVDWPHTSQGEDAMLADLASLDHVLASSLWRVRHEMTAEELAWLDFTCAGDELIPDGANLRVNLENKRDYVRLSCTMFLRQRCLAGLRAFCEGFFDVIPESYLQGAPEEGVLRLVAGEADITDAQLTELEGLVVPGGIVPQALCTNASVRGAAAWVFQTIREGDRAFRSRLLEFWLGVGRAPIGGLSAVRPSPKLQIMVQGDRHHGVKRIASWPATRLPEGHTCGNELWMALPESYEDCSAKLRLAVGNFEAGFALK